MWEYNIVRDSWDLTTGGEKDREEAIAGLNKSGADGWELVAVERVSDGNAVRLLYFLKRPKKQ